MVTGRYNSPVYKITWALKKGWTDYDDVEVPHTCKSHRIMTPNFTPSSRPAGCAHAHTHKADKQ